MDDFALYDELSVGNVKTILDKNLIGTNEDIENVLINKWNDLAVMHLRSFHFGIFSRAKIPPDSQICGAILLCLEAEAAGTATSTVHRHRSYRPLTLHSYRHSGVNDRSLSSLGPNCVMTSKKF